MCTRQESGRRTETTIANGTCPGSAEALRASDREVIRRTPLKALSRRVS